MKIKKNVSFHGWKKCVELTNGNFRIIVTTEIGPRVVGAFLGKSDNLFYVFPEYEGSSGQTEWVNYGGHRIWHSPEDPVRTYQPDSTPVKFEKNDDGSVTFTADTEKATGIQKSITISPEGENSFQVEHTIRNKGLWNADVAAWAVSLMAPGGVAVVPQNSEDTGLLPSKSFVFWPYAKLSDPRYVFGDNLLLLKQTPDGKPTKVGLNAKEGWCAYINHGVVFAKCFEYFEGEEYPDFGVNVEVYSCERFLELETLSPLVSLEPGDAIQYSEIWTAAIANTDMEINNEDDVVLALGLDEDDDCCCDDDDCCCDHDHGNECNCGCEASTDSVRKNTKKKAKASKKASKKK